MNKSKKPDWYDESKLIRVYYAANYTGWVIDLGDGTGRYATDPLLGCDDMDNPKRDEINANRPRWGDRVRLIDFGSDLLLADKSQILERYVP